MAGNGSIGSIAELWRFSVKSMGGERLIEGWVTERGLIGDRAYALVEIDTGRVVSAKSARLFPGILDCKARFREPPQLDNETPPVVITLPDGDVVNSDSGSADDELTSYFGRKVALRRSAPDDFTVDQYHPDVEGADPGGNRDNVVQQKLGAALFVSIGMESPVPSGSFLDVFPISVLTSSTLARLSESQPRTNFDPRRFRMNVIIKTESAGFIENAWVGRTLKVGVAAELNIALADPRCVMVTLAHDGLEKDTDVLKALVQYNRLQLGDLGAFPCAGVYAVVSAPGVLQIGDDATLE